MNTLIIFTHPAPESLNRSFLRSTLEGLYANGQISHMEVLDLYREGFNPALVFNEEKRRRDMHRDPELASYRQKIKEADTLIFIYPIWWGRPPAMLLGFFDRIMASGYAYRDRKGSPYPEGLMKGKRVICISTMKGPSGYTALLLNNAHKVLMRKALFNFIGIRKVKFFEFGSMEKSGGSQTGKLALIRKYMENLDAPSGRRGKLELQLGS